MLNYDQSEELSFILEVTDPDFEEVKDSIFQAAKAAEQSLAASLTNPCAQGVQNTLELMLKYIYREYVRRYKDSEIINFAFLIDDKDLQKLIINKTDGGKSLLTLLNTTGNYVKHKLGEVVTFQNARAGYYAMIPVLQELCNFVSSPGIAKIPKSVTQPPLLQATGEKQRFSGQISIVRAEKTSILVVRLEDMMDSNAQYFCSWSEANTNKRPDISSFSKGQIYFPLDASHQNKYLFAQLTKKGYGGAKFAYYGPISLEDLQYADSKRNPFILGLEIDSVKDKEASVRAVYPTEKPINSVTYNWTIQDTLSGNTYSRKYHGDLLIRVKSNQVVRCIADSRDFPSTIQAELLITDDMLMLAPDPVPSPLPVPDPSPESAPVIEPVSDPLSESDGIMKPIEQESEADASNSLDKPYGTLLVTIDPSFKGTPKIPTGVRLKAILNASNFDLKDNGVVLSWNAINDDGSVTQITSYPGEKGCSFICKLDKAYQKALRCIVTYRDYVCQADSPILTEADFAIQGEVNIAPKLGKNEEKAPIMTLKASISGANYQGQPVYQWFRNDSIVAGADGRVIQITRNDIGASYVCRITHPELTGDLLSNPYCVESKDFNGVSIDTTPSPSEISGNDASYEKTTTTESEIKTEESSIKGELFTIEKPAAVSAPEFSCFESDVSRLHYLVAPRNDLYATNSLKCLDFYSYLYLLLREQGYERVILVKHRKKGDCYPVVAYDKKAELSFLNPAAFTQDFDSTTIGDKGAWENFFQKLSQATMDEGREIVSRHGPAHTPRQRLTASSKGTPEAPVFGERVIQLISEGSAGNQQAGEKITFKAFCMNQLKPALEQTLVKTAIVLPVELLELREDNNEFCLDNDIADRIRDQIVQVGESTLIISLEHKSMLAKLFDIPAYRVIEPEVYNAVANLQEATDPTSHSQAIYDALTIENEDAGSAQEKVRILCAARRPGKDEIANLLLRQKIDSPTEYAALPYSKIYALAEFLFYKCANKEQTKAAFPALTDRDKTWDSRRLAMISKKLESDAIRSAIIQKANELPSRTILPAEGWKASCVERIYTKIGIIPTNKNHPDLSYAGAPVVEREAISAGERAAMREAALSKLNQLIGLAPVKNRLITLLDAAKNPKAYKGNICPGHYVFVGNPGTGKTTVARLVGEILRSEGLLKRGHVVEVKKADLVSEHIGGTQAKSLAKFEEALDGVLFFDEAYELVNASPTADSPFNSSFDEEAYTLLLKFMEDNRERLCVICAGYKDKMEKFLDANEGMRGRFSETIEFPDYSADELYSILQHDLQEMTDFLITDGYLAEAKKVMAHMSEDAASGLEQFSNARSIRRFVEESIHCAVDRDSGTDRLTEADIPPKYKSADLSAEESRKLQEQAWAKLDEMIGLGGIKAKLRGLIEYSARAAGKNRAPGHYAFVGNPGTGKTETARLMADILHANGLLRTNNFVEAKGADLVGKYIGHSAPQALAKCEEAIDGVLFVDEAYTLVSNDPVNGPFASSFAKESYEAIMKFMEDYRQRICVIFAGYKDEMGIFLDANPGMRSRISPANVIEFKDFSDDELIQITKLMAEKRDDFHFALTEEYLNAVRTLLPGMRTAKNFGNARAMRDFLTECVPVYMQRVPRTERIVLDDGVEQITLTADDIPETYRSNTPPQVSQEDNIQQPVFSLIPKSVFTELPDPYENVDIHSVEFPKFCCNAVVHINNEYGDATAFVVSPDGYAITCTHSVAYKKDLSKIAKDGLLADFKISGAFEGQLPYEIINVRPDLDMALIKINTDRELPYLKLAPEDREINIGEECSLYGFPDGREGIMRFPGTVSTQAEQGGDGELGSIYYFSGEAHPGDSGGPVIAKTDGCVIGILRGARGPKGRTMHNYMKPINYFWKSFFEKESDKSPLQTFIL